MQSLLLRRPVWSALVLVTGCQLLTDFDGYSPRRDFAGVAGEGGIVGGAAGASAGGVARGGWGGPGGEPTHAGAGGELGGAPSGGLPVSAGAAGDTGGNLGVSTGGGGGVSPRGGTGAVLAGAGGTTSAGGGAGGATSVGTGGTTNAEGGSGGTTSAGGGAGDTGGCSPAEGCCGSDDQGARCNDSGVCTSGDSCMDGVCRGELMVGCSIAATDTTQTLVAVAYPKAQSFIAPAHVITRARVYLTDTSAAWRLRILSALPVADGSGAAGALDPADLSAKTIAIASGPTGVSEGWVEVDLVPDAEVVPGQQYFLFLESSAQGPGGNWSGSQYVTTAGPYPDGEAYYFVREWLAYQDSAILRRDYAFEIFVD